MNGYLTICANDSSEEFNLIGYAEIDGGKFKGTLWIFKQWLALKNTSALWNLSFFLHFLILGYESFYGGIDTPVLDFW